MTVSQDKNELLRERMKALKIHQKDIAESFIRASGRGGQKVNKTSSCVVLRHVPTGISVKCQEDRSQSVNRYLALRRLVAKIEHKVNGLKSEEAKRRHKIRKQKQRRSRRAKEKMLEDKKRRSQLKESRRPIKAVVAAFLALALVGPESAWALILPENVLVVYNSQFPGSKKLAEYYAEKRDVPTENVTYVLTSMKEGISREKYENTIRDPIKNYLEKKHLKERILSIVLMRGIPLKIHNKKWSKKAPSRNSGASVDSELALLYHGGYSIEGRIANPFYFKYQSIKDPQKIRGYMVCRIDGPDREVCERMIDRGILAEKEGLIGKAYFDARGRGVNAGAAKDSQGYSAYDASIRYAAKLTESCGIETVLNNVEELFGEGECSTAALYCGWYSYGRYVDAFDFVPGAIAYHIASGEAHSLRKGRAWCKRLIEDGVSVTIGPVSEPFIDAFPIPELFFAFILSGKFNICEAFYLTKRAASWKMVLIGDPLYNPYKNNPLLSPDALENILDTYLENIN